MLRLCLTGRVSVSSGERTVDEPALAGRIGRLLLARLAVAAHPVERDRLVEDLWPAGPPRAVDSVLNATCSRLRTALASLGVDARAVLLSGGGVVELRPPPGSRVDVLVAYQAVDAAEAALRQSRLDAAWADAVVAHAIAKRPLLPGAGGVWLDDERDRLQHAHERSLGVLADVWLAKGDAHQSSVMARELVRCAPWSEASHRRLVTALLALEDRAAAAHAVARWEQILATELDLPVDDRLRRLLAG